MAQISREIHFLPNNRGELFFRPLPAIVCHCLPGYPRCKTRGNPWLPISANFCNVNLTSIVGHDMHGCLVV